VPGINLPGGSPASTRASNSAIFSANAREFASELVPKRRQPHALLDEPSTLPDEALRVRTEIAIEWRDHRRQDTFDTFGNGHCHCDHLGERDASSARPVLFHLASSRSSQPNSLEGIEMTTDADELQRLGREVDEAELYELHLRERIVAIRDALAAGQASRALSICNETLNEFDNATDVVAASPPAKSRGE
jgi:hypothetical protein